MYPGMHTCNVQQNNPFVVCLTLPIMVHFAAICVQGCVNGRCGAPNSCSCNSGWTGSRCTESKSIDTHIVKSTYVHNYTIMHINNLAIPMQFWLVMHRNSNSEFTNDIFSSENFLFSHNCQAPNG